MSTAGMSAAGAAESASRHARAVEPAQGVDGHAAIRATIAAIPQGRVASYGEIALRAGLPGRARLVGRVLRETEQELPWHRVLRADGRIAFAPGSRAFREQVRRLAAEGVLAHDGRIDLAQHGWGRDLDRLLWGPESARTRRR